MKTWITLAAALLMTLPTLAADTPPRIEPPHWWVGMRNTSLQLMLHAPGIADARPTLAPRSALVLDVTDR